MYCGFLQLRGAPSTVKNFVTGSSCSTEGAPPKNETVPTVLHGGSTIVNDSGDGICSIFQGLGISNRTKPGNCSESVSGVLDFAPEAPKPHIRPVAELC